MKRWQFWTGILITLLSIAFVVSQVKDPAKFISAFKEADYGLVLLVIASYFLVMAVRAVRWRYIMQQAGPVRLATAWNAILVCYMGNNLFPLRAGEFMRIFLVGKKEPAISYSEAFASVVVERLFDFLVMLVTLAAVLILVPFPPGHEGLERAVRRFGTGTLTASLLALAFLWLLYLKSEQTLSLMERAMFFLPLTFKEKVLADLERFAKGLIIMGRPRGLAVLFGMSFLVWFVNLSPVWLSGLAFNLRLSFTDCMFLLVVGAAAASIPATPGFFGTFHAFNQQALVFLKNLDPETALSLAIVLHGAYYFPMIIAGAIAAWKEGWSLTRLRHEAEKEAEQA